MRSEDLIARARRAAAALDGVRVKARMPDALWSRVTRCAAACQVPAEEWTCQAARAFASGRYGFGTPACDPADIVATRDDSRPRWLRLPPGFDRRDIRTALATAVAHAEPRIRPVTPQPGTEHWTPGRDYLLAP